MKIKLTEEIQGQQHNETSYEGPSVAVGRNPATCQIVFDQKKWPTVSRQHAQFQFHEGRWFLVDSGSTYGTFLNGQQVKNPVPLQAPAKVQFGTDGPILVVTGFLAEPVSSVGAATVVDMPKPVAVAPAPALHPDAQAMPTRPPNRYAATP
ncbi:MAG TPA: FHA domain-containing protein, partial [Pyrinomonadaceae bacterium]